METICIKTSVLQKYADLTLHAVSMFKVALKPELCLKKATAPNRCELREPDAPSISDRY